MRIVHVSGQVGRMVHNPDQHALAGIGNAILQTAAAQVEMGHDVSVLGFSEPFPAGRGTWQGVRIQTVNRWNWARLTAAVDASLLLPLFARLLPPQTIDVLHVHELGLLRLPVGRIRIMHVHIPLGPKVGESHLWGKAHAIACVSEFVRTSMTGLIDFRADRIYTAYNGAPVVRPDDFEARKLRLRLGISDQQIMVSFAGALVPQKGPDILLKALRELLDRNPALSGTVKLVIAGGSELWRMRADDADAYERSLRTLSEGLDVSFMGLLPHQQILQMFQACDIVVTPSVFAEPFGMVVCEAMAAGKPVVASSTGGIPEIIRDGQTGILFPPGDYLGLAHALQKLIEDPVLRTQMGLAAQERAAMFTWQATATRLNGIYESLC